SVPVGITTPSSGAVFGATCATATSVTGALEVASPWIVGLLLSLRVLAPTQTTPATRHAAIPRRLRRNQRWPEALLIIEFIAGPLRVRSHRWCAWCCRRCSRCASRLLQRG